MADIVNIFEAAPRNASAPATSWASLADFVRGYSIEVMPRTAAKISDFRAILPAGTRVYVAHIDGTPFDDMRDTVARLIEDGFEVMPHVPARIIPDRATLEDWVQGYADLGVTQALVLGGGVSKPAGDFSDSMQLLETGLFDKLGFTRLHVAGHPEGNRDIDPDGGSKVVDEALGWKQAFAERTDAEMAIVTQFMFEAGPAIAWADRLAAEGVDLPIHIGVSGPAKLQTLIKFAIACGVGPSLRVLQRRALDMTKLLKPFEPTEILQSFADEKAARPSLGIAQLHLFPLGGIKTAAEYANGLARTAPIAATA